MLAFILAWKGTLNIWRVYTTNTPGWECKIYLFATATTCYTDVWRRKVASCGRHHRKAQQWSSESIQISMSLARRTCQWASGYRFVRGRKFLQSRLMQITSCGSRSAGRSRAEVTLQVRLLQRCSHGVAVSQPSPSLPLLYISTLKILTSLLQFGRGRLIYAGANIFSSVCAP